MAEYIKDIDPDEVNDFRLQNSNVFQTQAMFKLQE